MKKILLISLLALALMLTACGGNSAYDEYSRAYKMLRQESSFATSTRQFYHSIDPATGAMDTYEASADSRVVKTDGGYDGISYTQFYGEEDSYSAEVYIRDGRSYSVVYEGNTDEGFRSSTACDPDSALKMATEGVTGLLEHTKDFITEQTVTDSGRGKSLQFYLDTEKFYAWMFGEPDEGTRYISEAEPPCYTVRLDEEGRLEQVLFYYWLKSTDDKPSSMQYELQVDFLQYGDIELDFPELNEEDYPDIYAMADQTSAE